MENDEYPLDTAIIEVLEESAIKINPVNSQGTVSESIAVSTIIISCTKKAMLFGC
ncbi:hypothetical protein [Bacillus cereus group sp. BfR-BA-01383]|uniref:hypothetical protein n=1 Tax=Bacillus cereus group sp. BfR-BA-01383 TaxID=2920327 RepID=UPI001F58A21D|nr:hypothetical protein [Bacillus cereus group sp. BfR-BA-01383]